MAVHRSSINRINSDLQMYPFYADANCLQKYRNCPDTANFLKVEVDTIPAFLFAISTTSTFELRIYDATDDSLQQTFVNATMQSYIYEEPDSGNDFLIISTSFINAEVSSLGVGAYYMQIDVDSTTYYGETFQVVDSLVNQTGCRWYRLKWSYNCHYESGEFYSSDDDGKEVFTETLMIPYTDMELRTTYEYTEEVTETGEGIEEPDYKRLTKRHVLSLPTPQFALGAIENIPMADGVTLVNNMTFVDYSISNVVPEGNNNLDQSCWSVYEMSFEIGGQRGRSIYNSVSCCDNDIYADTPINEIFSNECNIAIYSDCDFDVLLTISGADLDVGTGEFNELTLTANVYDKGTAVDYTPTGTLEYVWKFVDNDGCECETLADNDNDTVIKNLNAGTPFDNKGKYIVEVTDNGTGCTMSAQYNYQSICRNGDIFVEEDPTCDPFSVSIDYDATNGQLTAAPEDTPPGETVSYAWYRTDSNGITTQLSSTASTINLGTVYADYEVIATAGTCQASATFTYSDPCEGFQATKTVTGDSISYTPPSGYSPTYSWVYIDTAGVRTNLGTTVTTHVAQDTGYYEFTMTDGDCEWINTTYMEVSDCTGKSVEITISGLDMTAVPTGFSGSETYAWYLDSGSGYASLSATDAQYTATETGAYKVEVTESGCTVEDMQVVIVSQGCDATATITKSGANLEVTVTDCDGDVTVSWYYWNGTNFVYVGGGLTHTPSNQGVYKAEIDCEDCSDIIELYIDDEGN